MKNINVFRKVAMYMNEKVDNLDFELTPLEEHVDFEDQGKYTKLSTSEAQRL